MSLPEHCLACWKFLDKMGSCPYPGESLIWSVLSTIPYLAAFTVAGMALFKRKLSLFVSFGIILSCYLLADIWLKNLFKDPRPLGACKKGFGMPSSHMVVTGQFAVLMVMNNRKDIFLALGLSALQAWARHKLHYHYFSQIIAGYLLGIVYTVIAVYILRKLHLRYKGLLRRIPFLIDDIEVDETHKN